ncbi:ADP-ribosyltransferase [Petrocella sp. FN5]|uniref:ADP-ribosyltransferase n=1 Tax=Petrocella sp. FN5 TaxID=3032002 RepID=UPI0023D996D2|nr:ADP-ribosyltransferase [Petrocella sp. FN5]MDF1617295.1 ADP-ribosyltransferase [Petrocella sp. FN5]
MNELEEEMQAKDWINENYNELVKYLQINAEAVDSKNVAYLLYSYGGSMDKWYNQILRDMKGDFRELKKKIDNSDDSESIEELLLLKDFISDYPLEKDLIVYRYIRLNLFGIIKLILKKVGSQEIEHGFLSTTLLPFCSGMLELKNKKRYNTLLKIHAKKGTACIPLQFNEEQSKLKEYEMLFPPGIIMSLTKKTFNIKSRCILLEYQIL